MLTVRIGQGEAHGCTECQYHGGSRHFEQLSYLELLLTL